MRIYVYTPSFVAHAGLERSMRLLMQGLISRGHECKLLVMRSSDKPSDVEDADDPNVILCGQGRVHKTRTADPVIHAILDLQHTMRLLPAPDVILTLTPMCTGIARAVIESMDIPAAIVSRVSGPLSKYDHFESLTYADAHLAVSSGIAEKIVELAPNALVETVYHPLLDEPIRPVPRAEIPTFVYIGRMHNIQKRIDVMFRALAALPNKRWRLKLIEDAPPEPGSSDEIRMKDLAIKLGIADRIDWIGYSESPWDEVDEATLLILSSDWEAYCYVLIEALVRGIPVISSDCPTGPRDIVQPNVNGWLFKPGDVLGLAGTISRIMSGSLTLPDAETCRRSIARFDQERVMDQIEQALLRYVREKERQII